ncbi:MAG: GNAT family N-acetyltransferase [Bacteroidia bacterium]|nr:GNAT family N-acetyltransferase [Bacteroidia bacterium]
MSLPPITLFHRLEPNQILEVFNLWNNEYPEKLSHDSVESMDLYLEKLENPIHFISKQNEKIVGWASTFTRDYERWFFLIVSSEFQKMGIGKSFINEILKHESNLHGWVIDHSNDKKKDGTPYPSPLSFYLKLGFIIQASKRLETNSLSAVKISYLSKVKEPL